MTNEYSVNMEETATASKIKLVVTDPDTAVTADRSQEPVSESLGNANAAPLQQARPATVQPSIQADAMDQGITDPDKVMRDLPVDEFFRVLEQSTPEQLQALIQTFEKGARTKSGSKLVQKIIEVPEGQRSILSTVLWWEWRRPLYNFAVGLAGLPSLLLLAAFGMGTPALICALIYGFVANVFYSLGAPAELVARACYKERDENYGPVLLTLGTIFSVIVTILIEVLVTCVIGFGSFIR
jgi:hypothetical protein